MDVLLESGADADLRDRDGRTALMIAAGEAFESEPAVRLLLQVQLGAP